MSYAVGFALLGCGWNYPARHSHQSTAAAENASDCPGAIDHSFLGFAWGKVRSK